MAILLVADHNNTALSAETAKTATAATQLGGELHVLVAGSGCGAVGEAASKLDGTTKVLLAEAPHLEHQLAEEMTALIVPLMADYEALVFAATTTGKNIAPRVAALLDVMQLSDVIAVKSADTFDRPIYAGNAIQTVQTSDAKKVLTVRTTAFAAAADTGSAAIEKIEAPSAVGISAFASAELSKSDRPELTSAKIIVSGGRGLGSTENFQKYLEPVVNRLGAAMGASRAAVDAGFVPNDLQVGQTGKVVAPELYIAVGISGAIQHLAGMKDSKIIVAINKDGEAPIFQIGFGQLGTRKSGYANRTTAFAAAADTGSAAIEKIEAPSAVGISAFASAELSKSDRPELTSAKIIVSGGRGLGSTENFQKYLEPVVNRLGAAMGASRAAVDAGFVPNDLQVGQTGKVVAPELYIAVGISGAIQHLAGMKDSKIIVAINKDGEAPIFQIADYGLVADLFEVLPELDAELQKAGL